MLTTGLPLRAKVKGESSGLVLSVTLNPTRGTLPDRLEQTHSFQLRGQVTESKDTRPGVTEMQGQISGP